ncbi:hypothetical protein G5B30_09175 [Sphingobacterium sp. SGG-5]|uniref:hypothetical protein n=1 Tax=Sphingobacterium sp. SGG-5 TaxID=2710881 RepID=UPI0013ED1E8F|nr:hypothetical protein [Sphingobacterium sp. SGG-5]NGM62084.1 hypothetical protein [Sphingobacterium sp. SGG-5]
MKTTGIIGLVLACILGMPAVRAQSENAAVSLSIVLRPLLNLTVNPEQTTSSLVYNTAEDYQDGVEVTNKGHLTVFSTGPYVVNARLANEEYAKITGETDEAMHLPDVSIAALPTEDGGTSHLETSLLTTEDKSFILEDQPALNKVFDVSFHGPGDGAFLKYASKQGATTFTNTIIYSLEVR